LDWNHGPKLYSIPGIIRAVGTRKGPIPIPETEINAIKQVVQSPLDYQPCPFGKTGDIVFVAKGPLAGIHGIVEHCSAQQIVISVPLLHRSVAVTVDPSWLVFTQPTFARAA
jgi:transcription antitermination factor NusG